MQVSRVYGIEVDKDGPRRYEGFLPTRIALCRQVTMLALPG